MDSKKIDRIILGAVAVVFFVSSLILVFGLPGLFVSPDAVANFVFTSNFIDYGNLSIFESRNLIFSDSLFPRSTVSIAGQIVPISFVGLPVLYGLIGKIFGLGSVVLYTPLVAALALFAWRGVVEKVFNQRIGLISAIVLAVHPAWWYYTARGMMHNVLFVSLLIFAAWFWVVEPWKKTQRWPGFVSQYFDSVCAGLLLGLALFVRTSEIIWIAVAAMVALVFFIKKIKWSKIVLLGLSTLIVLLPMLLINNQLYGSPLTFGYTAQEELAGVEEASSDFIGETVEETAMSILPFGFEMRSILKHVYQYGFGLFWWLSVLVVIGLIGAWFRKKTGMTIRQTLLHNQTQLLFHVLFLVVGVILVVIYGSWTFNDNPDPNLVTIGNSYIRYWLPVFLFCTVYVALAIEWLRLQISFDRFGQLVSIGLILIIAALGFRATFFAPEDGLLSVRANLVHTAEIKAELLSLTELDSIIIVYHGDKILFPERTVRYPLRDETTYELMPRIILRFPLYYYGITFPEIDMQYLNSKKLAEMDLQIELIKTFDQESLYQITKK